MTRLLELCCARCGREWDVQNPADGATMEARELGDGSICLGCPDCHADIAVVEPPTRIEKS